MYTEPNYNSEQMARQLDNIGKKAVYTLLKPTRSFAVRTKGMDKEDERIKAIEAQYQQDTDRFWYTLPENTYINVTDFFEDGTSQDRQIEIKQRYSGTGVLYTTDLQFRTMVDPSNPDFGKPYVFKNKPDQKNAYELSFELNALGHKPI